MVRFDRLLREWLLVLLAAGLALSAGVALDVTSRFDNVLYDLAMRHSRHEPDPRILLVSIDNRSIAAVGAWPWPRSVQARLLERLAAARPRAIALDLLLTDPGDPAGDGLLARAIAGPVPVYLPVQFDVPGRNGAAYDVVQPFNPFRRAAAGLGHVNLAFDADGTVRRAYRSYADGTQAWPQLVALMAGGLSPQPGPVRPAPTPISELRGRQPMLINFAGMQGAFPTISAISVLRGEVPPELLRGRLVIVGATASGLGDAYATPAGNDGALTPGVEIQANLLDSLLGGRAIAPVSGPPRYAFALLPLLVLLVALRFLRPVATLATIAGLALLVLATSLALLVEAQAWLAPGCALLGILAIYPVWTWRQLAAVSRTMASELQKLDAEHDPLERPRPDLRQAGFVRRQTGLLRSAIDRERDLRRFLTDRILQMPDAVIVADRTGKAVLANAGAVALFRELGGTWELAGADELLALLDHGGQPIRLAEISGGDRPGWNSQAQSGQGRSFDVRCEPQRSVDGVLLGHVIRIVDTTAITALQRQREDVLQLLTHDMRAPQASIIALLDHAGPAEWAPDLAARIRGYANRTLKLADDFVQLSRAELMAGNFQDLDIVDTGCEAVDALGPQARARRITLDFAAPEDELVVRGEPSLLARALINLLDNAIKFSADGSTVRLTISRITRDQRVHARCTVADSGPGIAADQLAMLYQRFARASSGPASRVGGVGLGLAFVHTVAMRHGGTIQCENSPGQGACFHLDIPLGDPPG